MVSVLQKTSAVILRILELDNYILKEILKGVEKCSWIQSLFLKKKDVAAGKYWEKKKKGRKKQLMILTKMRYIVKKGLSYLKDFIFPLF